MYSDLSQSLNTSLINSYNFRELLKTEALKMFDKDYDVLLYTIQDIQLEDGQTVKSILNKNLKNFNVDQILSSIPTLTIFIPELPENSFSASKWNLNEVPSIAFRSSLSNNIPYLDNNYNKNVIEANQIPVFPIIVLKENERIILSKNNANKQLKNGDNNIFEFWSDNFDNTEGTKAAKFLSRTSNISKKLNSTAPIEDKDKYIEAFDMYNPIINGGIDGWHRDYIYYDISPQQVRGEFKYNYQEFITNISFKNDSDGLATSIYKKIADQTGDPSSASASGWADGYFEIKVRSLINGSNGVGEELVTGITAKPSDFFEYNYKTTDPTRPGGTVYLVGVRAKSTPNEIKIPSLQWDLKDYSSSIKITFEEVDISETRVETTSRVTKFAANIGVDASFDLFKIFKMGLKFGANKETTQTVTNQITRNLASDELGEAIINFGDRVYIFRDPRNNIIDPSYPLKNYSGRTPKIEYRTYSTGYLDFNVIPLKVQ